MDDLITEASSIPQGRRLSPPPSPHSGTPNHPTHHSDSLDERRIPLSRSSHALDRAPRPLFLPLPTSTPSISSVATLPPMPPMQRSRVLVIAIVTCVILLLTLLHYDLQAGPTVLIPKFVPHILRPTSPPPPSSPSPPLLNPLPSYQPLLINALPYATHPNDSTATTLHINGHYPDSTTFSYPLCHFTRVCLTGSHVLLHLHNLTVWWFYRMILPYCHDVLWKKFELCQCFHYGYRPALLPFPYDLPSSTHEDEKVRAKGWANDRFGPIVDWSLGEKEWEQPTPSRGWPTLNELQRMTSHIEAVRPPTPPSTSGVIGALVGWYEELVNALAPPSPSSPSILYQSPFTFPSSTSPPSSLLSPVTPAGGGNGSIVHLTGHYWSIHKWVNHHHIAHWAQKWVALYTTLSHSHHACHHLYHTLPLNTSDLPPKVRGTTGGEGVKAFTDTPEGGGALHLECLPPINAVVLHDTYLPALEHESYIQQVSLEANGEWMETASPLPPHRAEVVPLTGLSTLPLSSPVNASSPVTVWGDHLYRQYPMGYDEGGHPRQLPPPVNVSALLCVARLSFSPMYGLLTENAYDFYHWRARAMQHYGLAPPPRPVPSLIVPRVTSSVSPYLHSVHPLAMTGLNELNAAQALLSCPPGRALLVLRPDRLILNRDELMARLYERFHLRTDPVYVSAATPTSEQAALFAGAGLIIAAHSSQLINMIFSGVGQAIVEVTPELYNLDFAQYARGVGVHFRYAVGGEVEGWVDPGERMRECLEAVKVCKGGDPWCVQRVRDEACKEDRHFPNKHKPFKADLDAVERAVRQSLGHLLRHCYDRWQQVQLTKLG